MNEEPRPAPPRLAIPTQRDITRCDVAGQLETLRGRRVILANESGSYDGYRAWGEVEVAADGYAYVQVVRERHWWMWDILGQAPNVLRWPATAVWVE